MQELCKIVSDQVFIQPRLKILHPGNLRRNGVRDQLGFCRDSDSGLWALCRRSPTFPRLTYVIMGKNLTNRLVGDLYQPAEGPLMAQVISTWLVWLSSRVRRVGSSG